MQPSTKQHLLGRLKETRGAWVSGANLSRELDISRTAVWKQVCSLRNEGYVIDSAPRKGYLLKETLDRLRPAEIGAALHSKRLGRRIVFESEVDSTNRLARDLAILGAVEGTIVVAESQTGGRGRKGRNWFSPPGEGIYVSLVLRPRFQPAEAPKMTLLTGVALAETLFHAVPSRVTIKWPNDVLLEGRKVAGILVEISTDIDAIDYMIVGVGMNINTPPDRFPADLRERATSLAAHAGHTVPRAEILGAFLDCFEHYYDLIGKEGFAPVIGRWRELSDMVGRRVRVQDFNRSLQGTIAGIDDDGVLLIKTADADIHRVIAGDVEYL